MARERNRVTLRDLPDDMDYLKAKVSLLMERAGIPADEDTAEEDAEKKDSAKEDEIEA